MPETPGDLYDLLQELFGIGDYDEVATPHDADLPRAQVWYRARSIEIAKIRSMLRKRRCTLGEVAVAAYYAADEGIPVNASWQVFGLVSDAKRAARARDRQLRQDGVLADRNLAAIEAMEAGEQGWADRLINASDQEVASVIDQWRNRDHD